MLINRDPDGKPNPSVELFDMAERQRMHIVNVICDDQDAESPDRSSVSFTAMMHFLPRTGDRIELEDGTACQVVRSYFKVCTERDPSGKAKCIFMMPNVLALKIGSRDDKQISE